MLKLADFRIRFYEFFRILMVSDAYLDFAYKGKLYRIEVTDLGIEVPTRKSVKKSLKKEIRKMKCKKCGALKINGVCMAPERHDLPRETRNQTEKNTRPTNPK